MPGQTIHIQSLKKFSSLELSRDESEKEQVKIAGVTVARDKQNSKILSTLLSAAISSISIISFN